MTAQTWQFRVTFARRDQRDEFSNYLQQHSGNIDQLSAELEKRAAAKIGTRLPTSIHQASRWTRDELSNFVSR